MDDTYPNLTRRRQTPKTNHVWETEFNVVLRTTKIGVRIRFPCICKQKKQELTHSDKSRVQKRTMIPGLVFTIEKRQWKTNTDKSKDQKRCTTDTYPKLDPRQQPPGSDPCPKKNRIAFLENQLEERETHLVSILNT